MLIQRGGLKVVAGLGISGVAATIRISIISISSPIYAD
jgi:hypothetical protein